MTDSTFDEETQSTATQASQTPQPPQFDMPEFREEENHSREEFTTVFDIIDQLDQMVEEARGSLFAPGSVRVNREELTDKLGQLKTMLPVQLERASALMREAERRLVNAQTQANAIVASAQSKAATMVAEANEQVEFLVGQENITAQAHNRARSIVEQAQARADKLTSGADQYCTDVMENLHEQLAKLNHGVEAGLDVLHERQRQASERMQSQTQEDDE